MSMDLKSPTRVVADDASPGKFVAQYYDNGLELWFDIGDPKDTRELAQEHLIAELNRRDREQQLRNEMIGLMRGQLGGGLVDDYYAQAAEPFVQLALRYGNG